MKGFHHSGGSQAAFLTGLAHLYNLIPDQRRAKNAGLYGVEVEGGRVPTSDWSRMKAPCCLSAGGFLQALPAPDKHVSAHPAVQLWLLHTFSQSTRLPFFRVTTRQPIACPSWLLIAQNL